MIPQTMFSGISYVKILCKIISNLSIIKALTVSNFKIQYKKKNNRTRKTKLKAKQPYDNHKATSTTNFESWMPVISMPSYHMVVNADISYSFENFLESVVDFSQLSKGYSLITQIHVFNSTIQLVSLY